MTAPSRHVDGWAHPSPIHPSTMQTGSRLASRHPLLVPLGVLAIVATLGIAVYGVSRSTADDPPLAQTAVHHEVVAFPGDVIKAWGQYVATEIFSNRLAVSQDAGFPAPVYLQPAPGQRPLASPHYLGFSENVGLIVSEGWGGSIALIANPTDQDWRRPKGPSGDKLNGPHGVCVGDDGWIYVADSLKSRLVRYRPDSQNPWQVFDDPQGILGYGRQLLCRPDGVWVSNSYEDREGIHPGNGGNVVRIVDFEQGQFEIVATFPATNITGIEVIDDRYLVVGLWGSSQSLVVIDLEQEERRFVYHRPEGVMGPPYGFHFDPDTNELLVTWLGDIHQRTNRGAISVYRYKN